MIYFNELKKLFDQSPQKGYNTWMHLWSENPWYPLQCDISNMISPAMYEEFVMPRLTRTARELGQAVYHLDGPGEWQHLDYILSIPEIKAIQYQSVDTDPPNEASHWLPYYRRIAEAGKGVFFYVYTQDIEQVYKLSQEMPAEKLAFHMWLPSKEDAQALLKRFKR
ncbi:MAG: hypothetical protein JW920_08010 [Deltaproteobacteria bacterium]|nr:hypothetical protein [Deltaproteobacteria bacterium]